MTCDEFERVLPELVGEHTVEQAAHLRSCFACAELLADLNVISGQAMLLQDLEEPGPRVWEFLQNALRSEGLIREQVAPVPRMANQHALEDEDHVYFCSECSVVREDLNAISEQARFLQDSEEPSPRIWNSLEIALRNEGVVRQAPPVKSANLMPPRWRLAWVIPSAALAMLVLGTALFQRGGMPPQVGENSPDTPTVSRVADSSLQAEERELVRAVGERAPALKAGYEADLKVVDAYISDAEQSAKANPQDEVAQQYLRSAYDQRAMIYEMAMK